MFTDLYKSDIPWDIVTDDSGKVIGEVYKHLPVPPPRRRQVKWGMTSSPSITGLKKSGKEDDS
ncbi:hypothetical protein B2I21_33155 [Chryseobacterium mucoviscidosis]|nr:hypothetical protein B2I21_33155 [Chryseobacterium mucoviscidosis]